MLHLRTIYYFDIEFLSLEETSGLSAEEIRENYDALIDYNLIYQGVEELELPSFPMSREGEIHFEEVKRIFTAIQYLFLVTGILTVFGLPPEDSKERFRKPEADAVPSFTAVSRRSGSRGGFGLGAVFCEISSRFFQQ